MRAYVSTLQKVCSGLQALHKGSQTIHEVDLHIASQYKFNSVYKPIA